MIYDALLQRRGVGGGHRGGGRLAVAPLGVGPGVLVLPEGEVRFDFSGRNADGLCRGRALFVGVENAVTPKCSGCGSPSTKAISPLRECLGCGEDFCADCLDSSDRCSQCEKRENASDVTPEERAKFLRVARQALQDLGEEGVGSSRNDAKDFIFSQLPSRLSHDEKESIADEALRGQRKNAGSCNCESIYCKSHDIDKGEGCKNPAGSKKVDMLGPVCDSCAEVYRKANPSWVMENGEVVAVCYKCKTPLTEGSKCSKCGYLNTKENATPLDPRRMSPEEKRSALALGDIGYLHYLCEVCGKESAVANRRSGVFQCGPSMDKWMCVEHAFGMRENASAFCPNCDHDKNEHDTNGKCTLCDCLPCYPKENVADYPHDVLPNSREGLARGSQKYGTTEGGK